MEWVEKNEITPESTVDSGLRDKLLTGSISLVVLKGFIAPKQISDVTAEFESHRSLVNVSNYSNGALTTLGPYLAKHVSELDTYFEAAADHSELQVPNIQSLQKSVYDQLAKTLGYLSFETAVDDDHGSFSPYVIRMHENGEANPLHNDHIVRDCAGVGLLLEGLINQLSCVVCLQECTSGGHLKLYNKLWKEGDEAQHKVAGELGYRNSVVDGSETCVFKPAAGDIYIFNPTYYHEIDRVQGPDRLTMGFFFGQLQSSSGAIAWS